MSFNGKSHNENSASNKKKILIVSSSFYPMNSPRSHRTTELVKEFARQGHEVTLLTVKDDIIHHSFEEDYGIRIKDLGALKFPEINLHGSGIRYWVKRILRRSLKMFFEYPRIELMFKVKKALKKEADHDLLLSIAAPHPTHWGVAWAKSSRHPIAKVWAADCGDPYYGSQNDSIRVLYHFSFVEKWFCRKADFITIPFPGARSSYFDEFHPKIEVIPQGFSFPHLSPATTSNHTITFAYSGNIASYLHYAIPFLQKLNSIDRRFKFIVYTRRKDVFEENMSPETLEKCTIMDYVERDTLLEQLNQVDFLLHFPYRHKSQKSLKLVDYNFLKKPILSYKNDEESDRNFKEFLDYNFENKMTFEDCEKYKIENVCARFLNLLADKKPKRGSVLTD